MPASQPNGVMITMSKAKSTHSVDVGDWIEARGVHGQPSRRGRIVELLGHVGHEHYRVQWDEKHESIVYPADGIIITPRSTDHPHAAQAPDAPT
jgi:hypothetical protein